MAVTAQCTAVALLGTHVRAREGSMFYSTTAVTMAELFKFSTCLVGILIQSGSIEGLFSHLNRYIFTQPQDNIRVSIPALIYVLQNNLIYIAMSNLDASTFQVTNQLKILTTALFSVAMMRKRLSRMQWLSLLVLFIGVSAVQLQSVNDMQVRSYVVKRYPLIGFVAVVSAAFTSGFAGVYFEKLLKNHEQSLLVRNLQLSKFSPTSLKKFPSCFSVIYLSEPSIFLKYSLLLC